MACALAVLACEHGHGDVGDVNDTGESGSATNAGGMVSAGGAESTASGVGGVGTVGDASGGSAGGSAGGTRGGTPSGGATMGGAPVTGGASASGGAGGTSATGGAGDYDIVRKHGRDWVKYVEKGSHEVYIEASDIAGIPGSGPLPNGTTFLRPEGRPLVFFWEKRNEVWFHGEFSAQTDDAPGDFSGVANGECLPCHGQIHDTPMTEGIFTVQLLRRFISTGQITVLTCNESSNSPCDAAAYR
jgi:hypothetical protein